MNLDRGCRSGAGSVDAWLTIVRCSVKLLAAIVGAPVLALEHWLDVTSLCERLSLLVPS